MFWVYHQKNRCRRAENAYFRANGYSPNLFIILRIFVSRMIVSRCTWLGHTCSGEGSIFAMPLGPAPLSLLNFLYLALKRVQTLNIIPIRKIRKWNWSKDYKKTWNIHFQTCFGYIVRKIAVDDVGMHTFEQMDIAAIYSLNYVFLSQEWLSPDAPDLAIPVAARGLFLLCHSVPPPCRF